MRFGNIHITEDGEHIHIKNLSDSHLTNIINRFKEGKVGDDDEHFLHIECYDRELTRRQNKCNGLSWRKTIEFEIEAIKQDIADIMESLY